MNQEPSTHEKVLGSLEDAAMYQDLGADASERAAGAKKTWSKLRDRLDTVKQDHAQWRQGHKVSAWLHDNGWWKSGELAHHEDRQRRYTLREADAHIAHVNARDEVRRLDKNLTHSQDEASAGWRKLEQEQQQVEEQLREHASPEPALAHEPVVEHASPELAVAHEPVAHGTFAQRVQMPRSAALDRIRAGADDRVQEARDRLDQGFNQARDRIAELRDLNLVGPGETNEDLLQHAELELPGGATVSLTDFKTPMAPAIDQALTHQASNPDFHYASDDTTPLHTAVQENKLDLVQRLLDHGADPNFKISEFAGNLDSPLVPLMRAQTPEMVDLLCQNGADVQKCLWHPDMLATPELTQSFLDRGLDPNARTIAQVHGVDAIDIFNASELTQEPLEREVGESALGMTHDPEVARRLVLAGADIDANAGTRKEPLGVTQTWGEDRETGETIRVSKGPEFDQAIQSANQEREQSMSQQTKTFGSIDLPRTKQELQQEQSRPNLGQRVMEHNVELPQPGRRPSLGEAARAALQPRQQVQDDQGEGSGGRRGGQERPSHSSFYQPIPVGGMAPPNADERSAAIQQQEKARRRSLSRSF